jgi:hypothetical protein
MSHEISSPFRFSGTFLDACSELKVVCGGDGGAGEVPAVFYNLTENIEVGDVKYYKCYNI